MERRKEILVSFGAEKEEIEDLLTYNQNFFQKRENLYSFPLPDEAFIKAWENYLMEAKKIGVYNVLKKKLVQLQFPIEEGISQKEYYKAATRKGLAQDKVPESIGIELKTPEGLELYLYQTSAGKIPVIATKEREDFVTLVRALSHRNEPKKIPNSMGACMIKGYNNWDRIWSYKNKWLQENPEYDWEKDWSREFQKIVPQKHLYQDKIILLSYGFYSGIPAKEMGMSQEKWRQVSLIIRREHEATHYFTERVLGIARNNPLDELLADYMGIVAANDRFRADWFLKFMGLEIEGQYRKGGRLENYRGKPPLSEKSFAVLQKLVYQAALNLEVFDKSIGVDMRKKADGATSILLYLTKLTLEDLADGEALSNI